MIKRVPVPLSGGVNLFADPSKVRDDQCCLAKNLVPVRPGVIGTRPALQHARDVMLNPALGPYIPVRAMFSPIGPEVALALWSETAQQTLFLLIDAELGSTSEVIATGDAPVPVSMVQWDGDTYVFTGETTGARAVFANNPEGYLLEAITFEGTGNENFKPKGAAVIRDRFVYWGFEDGAGGRSVLFADRGQPLHIGDSAVASARYIPVAGIAQTGITHCAEINTQAAGSPNQSVVAVWTTDAMWMLLGEPGETGDGTTTEAIIGTLQQNLLPMAAGCVSGATVVQTPYGTIWAGPDDVWFMPFGSLPVRIGTNIRPALLNTPPGLKWKWHAAYDSDTAQYRLALFSSGSGPTEVSACNHHWILDLSAGPPQNADEARWFGPQEYVQPNDNAAYQGTHTLLTKTGEDGDREVYGLCWYSVTMSGTPGPTVEGISLVTLAGEDSRDSAAPNRAQIPWVGASEYQVGDLIVPYDEDAGECRPLIWDVTAVDGLGPNGGGVTAAAPGPQFNDGVSTTIVSGGVTFKVRDGDPDAGYFHPTRVQLDNEIVPELLTKEHIGDGMTDKLIDGAEMGYWTSETGELSYRFLSDVHENVRTLPETGDVLGVAGFTNSPLLPDPGNTRGQRIWGTRLLPMTVDSRSVAKSVQLRLTADQLFVIDDTNDTIVIDENAATAVLLTLTQGAYTYTALITHILATLEATYGAGWEAVSTNGSLEGLRTTTAGGGTFRIWCADTSGANSFTATDAAKCARLFSMLGFDANASTFGGGTGVGYIEVEGGAPGAWTMAKHSAEQSRSFRFQLSGLNLRVREFRRRPM